MGFILLISWWIMALQVVRQNQRIKERRWRIHFALVRDKFIKKLRWHFCKQTDHSKKDYPKSKILFKKLYIYIFICTKSNFVEVPNNTLWLDSCRTTHVSHIMRRFTKMKHRSTNVKEVWITEIKGKQLKTVRY